MRGDIGGVDAADAARADECDFVHLRPQSFTTALVRADSAQASAQANAAKPSA